MQRKLCVRAALAMELRFKEGRVHSYCSISDESCARLVGAGQGDQLGQGDRSRGLIVVFDGAGGTLAVNG